jgi:Undecaprenyl-phosphate glucose phosphotransferase
VARGLPLLAACRKVKTTSHRRPPARGAAPLDAANSARLSPRIFAGLVRTGEFALLSGLGFLLAYLYVAEFFRQYAAAMALAGLLSVAVFQALGLYTIPACANLHSRLTRLLTGWTVTVGALLATVFFLKLAPEFSRVWLALWYVGGAVGLLTYRAGVAAVTRRGLANGHLTRRAIVYGAGPASRSLIEALDSDPACDIRVCGVFDDRGVARTGGSIAGYPNLGNLDALVDYCRRARIDMLVVALPVGAETRVLELLKKLWVLPIDIRLAADASRLKFAARTYSFAGTVPLIDIIDRPITDWSVLAKWLFDMSVGLMALVGLAPVMALVALAVKLDSKGPVLFRQKRYGFNNQLIDVYKFRSMYVDQADANASKLVTKGDPRVTRVGRFIRKTSLDELPQLFNVIKGELSLVGPRPHALQAKAADRLYQDVVDGYFARHRVKPGITGWAQINGWRGETDTEEKTHKRVEHDLYYIDNWSVLFDLYILLKTPIALLRGENAY